MPDTPRINQAAGEGNALYKQAATPVYGIGNVRPVVFVNPGDTGLFAGFDPVINEVSNPNAGSAIEATAVSGEPPLSLPNSVGRPLKAWSADVLPYQEGTGDPAPDNVRPIYGTDKLNLFVEESYDQSATPKAVIDVPLLSANQWDEQWELGLYDPNTGLPVISTNSIRGKNPIEVHAGQEYYIVSPENVRLLYYNSNDGFVDSPAALKNATITIPQGVSKIRLFVATQYGATYNHDISINYPSTVTTYNPYNATVYTGTIGSEGGESRWGEVDLGTLTWINFSSGIFYASITGRKTGFNNIICSSYATNSAAGVANLADMHIVGESSGVAVFVKDTNFTTDPAEFKTAMSGVKLVYELATPTTFSVTAPTIPTPTGTATTWAMAEDGTVDGMEVTYIKSE